MKKFNQNISFTSRIIIVFLTVILLDSCKEVTEADINAAVSEATSRFATGTKGIKIITSVTALTGSFTAPTAVPTAAVIPSGYPGADGASTYLPGVVPTRYFDLDGTTTISKPSWLKDFQLGITAIDSNPACAAFGTNGTQLDPIDVYRVSEADCGVAHDGTGSGTDKVFARIVLDRDTSKIGSAENLLVQVEYQASGIHLNSDGSFPAAEDNLDQLWKIFWSNSLAASATPKPFAVFIPPNFAGCEAAGTGDANANTAADLCFGAVQVIPNSYRGSPVKVRQFLIPLSAYPNMKVIQFSRVKSRITAGAPDNYLPSFCDTDSPLCVGVVIRSITLIRM